MHKKIAGHKATAPAAFHLDKQDMYNTGLYAPDLLVRFLSLLAINAERGHGPGFESCFTNLFTAFLADAVSAVIYTLQSLFDFSDQLPFTVPYPEGEVPVRFQGGPVRWVRKVGLFGGHAGHGLIGLIQKLVEPYFKTLFEDLKLFLC